MGLSEILLTIQLGVFCLGFKYIFRIDRLFGLYFASLFIYCIFAQIGYRYYPSLSDLTNAYFGPEIWYPITFFIIMSFVLFILFFFFRNILYAAIPFRTEVILRPKIQRRNLVFFLIYLLALYNILYLVNNYDTLNWSVASDETELTKSLFLRLFIMIFKFTTGLIVLLYVYIREQSCDTNTRKEKTILILLSILFIFTSYRLGNRTDLIAICLGLLTYESYKSKLNLKKITAGLGLALLFVAVAFFIELNRYSNVQTPRFDRSLVELALLQDFYPPAHILFASFHLDYINPLMALKSNIANSLAFLDVPYLQQPITEMFSPNSVTRSTGYAFYIFTEGYLFMGSLGFIYNGLVLTFLLSIWRKYADTNNGSFNRVLLALMGTMLINLSRGQSSYFIRYFYSYLLPLAWIYLSLVQARLILRFKYSPIPFPSINTK